MFVAPVAGRFADRVGGKWILFVGVALFAGGMGILIDSAHVDSTRLHLLPGLIVAGFGLGMTFAPLQTIAMRDVEPRMAGAASGIIKHDAPARRRHRIGRRRRAAAVAAVDEARHRRAGRDQRAAEGCRPAVVPRSVRPRVQGRGLGRTRSHRAAEVRPMGHASAGSAAGPDRRRVKGDLRQRLHQRQCACRSSCRSVSWAWPRCRCCWFDAKPRKRAGHGRAGAIGKCGVAGWLTAHAPTRHQAGRRQSEVADRGVAPGGSVSRGRRTRCRRRRRARRPPAGLRPPRPPAARTGSGAPFRSARSLGRRRPGRSARRAGSRCRGLPGVKSEPVIDRRLPVEFVRPDPYQRARLRAEFAQPVFDTDAREAVAEITNGLRRSRNSSDAPNARVASRARQTRPRRPARSQKPVSSTAAGRKMSRVGSAAGPCRRQFVQQVR